VEKVKVTVIGAGSIGMLLAGQLAMAGTKVNLVTRTREQCSIINQHGLQVESSDSSQMVNIPCYSSLDHGQPADVVFLTVKQKDVTAAIDTIQKWTGPDTLIVALQNGWGHGELLSSAFPTHLLFMAVTTQGARKQHANHVQSTGKGETWIGLWDSESNRIADPKKKLKVEFIIDCLVIAGIQAYFTENIKVKMWNKWILNCVVNPLTAVLGVRNGELLKSPSTERLMKEIFKECISVAKAEQIKINESHLWETIRDVCRRTEKNHSSMLQDLKANRKTEIDAINGAMATLAEKHRISLPYNDGMIHLIHAKEDQGRRVRDGSIHS
jgi:2-dehydropantoate 2-reductase